MPGNVWDEITYLFPISTVQSLNMYVKDAIVEYVCKRGPDD